jgi:flagellar biosynthesis component FlhA
MWILSILPEAAIHTIFGLGILGTIAGFVLGFIPFVKAYKLAIQVISLLVLVLGVYLEGGLADYKEWEHKVKELEAKIAQAETKSSEKNVEIQEKIVEKTKIVKEKGRDIIKYIDKWNTKEVIKEVEGPERIKREEVIKYIENCPIPKEMIDIHNQAATLNKAAEGEKK